MTNLSEIREQSARAAEAVCEAARLRAGDLFVVGCSSSEVIGDQIGTNSSLETAEAVFEGIYLRPRKQFSKEYMVRFKREEFSWPHSAANISTGRLSLREKPARNSIWKK